jgi:hypothetical protein
MRILLTALTLCAALGTAAATPEKRIFFIANNADGYGIDRCLATGSLCGSSVATAYCRSHEFTRAVSFQKVARAEITGVIPAGTMDCPDGRCEQFVAIECTR